mgnify:CR=1 FL=1
MGRPSARASSHSGREVHSSKQRLLQELRDVVADAADAARLGPAERGGGQAGGGGGVPQRLGADGRIGGIALVPDDAPGRAVQHFVAKDPVAGGRRTGDQRGVARPRHARKGRAQPRRRDTARGEHPQRGYLQRGLVKQCGRKAVDADPARRRASCSHSGHGQRHLRCDGGAAARQRDAHRRAFTLLTLDRQLAAVRQHQVPDDRQSEPGATELPRARLCPRDRSAR